MFEDKTIGFLGAGAMAEALISGIINARLIQPGRIIVANKVNREKIARLHDAYGVQTILEKDALISRSNVIIIAVKPKDLGELLAEIEHAVKPAHTVISVAAGITTRFLEVRLGPIPVIRAMPNTSCRVRESATAISLGKHATGRHEEIARAIFGAVGRVETVPEDLMDAVTGLSGSGPAYIYFVMEALIEAGTSCGIPEAVARSLVYQTVLGSARMVLETAEEPSVLRTKVTSPGGTTEAGLKVLSAAGVRQAFVDAVKAATKRSGELSH